MKYVSHEIRTPLNTVFMGLQLCLKNIRRRNLPCKSGDPEAELEQFLVDIQDSCFIAISVLNDLLLYDKMEDGMMHLDKSVIGLRTLLDMCIHPFAVQVDHT